MLESISDLSLLAFKEGVRPETWELGVALLLPLVLSLILLKYANVKIAKGASPKVRWASLVPLIAGIWIARIPFLDILDENYREFNLLDGSKSEILHYAVVVLPTVSILAMIGYFLYSAHRERMER